MKKFRIRVAPCWFSDDYAVLKYSTNGIFWKTLKEYEYDVLDKWCYMVTKKIPYKDVEYLLPEFKSIDDIIKYEDRERQKVINHNNEISERNKKIKEEKRKIYEKYG